jgi:hypothetical protein
MSGRRRTNEKRAPNLANYFAGPRPLPIAHFQLPIVSQGGRPLVLPTDDRSLPARQLAIGNGRWAIFIDHGFRSVVLVILVNSFKISLQSVSIESCSLSSRNPPSCRRSSQNSVAEAFRSAPPISLAKTALDSASCADLMRSPIAVPRDRRDLIPTVNWLRRWRPAFSLQPDSSFAAASSTSQSSAL